MLPPEGMTEKKYAIIKVKPSTGELLAAIRVRIKVLRELLNDKRGLVLDRTIDDIIRRALRYYAAVRFGYLRHVVDEDEADKITRVLEVAGQIAEVDLMTEVGVAKAVQEGEQS